MSTTITLTANVPPNHQLTITLPDEIPTGPAEIVVVIASQQPAPVGSLAELAESEFFGLWRDRDDVADSADYARALREKAWSRDL